MNKDTLQKIRSSDIKNIQLQRLDQLRNQEAGLFPTSFSMPIGLQLELTRQCNLFCKHCYNASGGKVEADLMTTDKWIAFAKEVVADGGVFQCTISGGEPLLLGQKLFDIMDVFHNDGSSFVLISNGFLLDADICKKLSKYHFQWLQLSIDSVSPDRHDAFRGRKGSWQRVTEAAIRVSEAGLPLKIAISATPQETTYLEEFFEFCYQLGASTVVVGDIMPSGRSFDSHDIIMTKDEKIEFYEKILELKKKVSHKIEVQTSFIMKSQLEFMIDRPLDGVIIRPNGDVRLDCIAPFVIGNVLQDRFKTIWDRTPSNIWSSAPVRDFIGSIDEFGFSSKLNNYQDKDIILYNAPR